MSLKKNKLNFYVEDEVRKKLEKLAKESGLTMTAVISKLIMNRGIKTLSTEDFCRIYKELNHIGTNINQIAYIANSEKHISDERLGEVARLMNDVWKYVRSYR